VAGRFIEDARRARETVAFFSADDLLLQALAQAGLACTAVPIGTQPEWDPTRYTTATRERRTVRSQVRRASRKGVKVARLPSDDVTERASVRGRIERLAASWLATRRMPPMRFMVDVSPFGFADERRYYTAERDGHIVGALIAVPVYARRGWFFEDVLRSPDAPNGTVESLIDAALEDARSAGDGYVTLGLAPLAQVPAGPGSHRWLRATFRFCFARLGGLYPFKGLFAFKTRFAPHRCEPQYLVVVPPALGLRMAAALLDVLRAFAGGRLARFATGMVGIALLRIPRRAWAAAVFTMGSLLVPWTIALARADGVFWFGSTAVQRAWVVFDVFMACALGLLGALVRSGREVPARRLAQVLGGLATLDLILTTSEFFERHRDDMGWHRVVALAGIAGPLLATLLLGGLTVRPALRGMEAGEQGG
jgi:hypothetical protein